MLFNSDRVHPQDSEANPRDSSAYRLPGRTQSPGGRRRSRVTSLTYKPSKVPRSMRLNPTGMREGEVY